MRDKKPDDPFRYIAVRPPKQEVSKGQRKIKLLSFRDPVTSEEALKRFKAKGLERPSFADALRFIAEFNSRKEVWKHPVAFLHKPWLDPKGKRVVLTVRIIGSNITPVFEYFDDRYWNPIYVFGILE